MYKQTYESQREFGKSQRAVENREKWRKLVAKSSVVPQRPSRLRDWWWWWWLRGINTNFNQAFALSAQLFCVGATRKEADKLVRHTWGRGNSHVQTLHQSVLFPDDRMSGSPHRRLTIRSVSFDGPVSGYSRVNWNCCLVCFSLMEHKANQLCHYRSPD